jgi:hypothetical protein
MTLALNELLGRTWQLLHADRLRVVPVIVILTGLGFLVDSGLVEEGFNVVVSGATFAAQYWITRSLLGRIGYPIPRQPRGLAFIGLALLSGIGILLGLVLLVVPGLVLAVRWSIANPWLLSSDESISDCLRRSWHQTGVSFWPIFATFLIIYVPAALVAVAAFVAGEWGEQQQVGIVIAGLATNLCVVTGWIAAIAIFSFLNPAPGLSEIFE